MVAPPGSVLSPFREASVTRRFFPFVARAPLCPLRFAFELTSNKLPQVHFRPEEPSLRTIDVEGKASNCGKGSVISNHGALEPTNTWKAGRTPGSLSRVPIARPSVFGLSANKLTSVAPHTRQKVRTVPGEDSYRVRRSAPDTHRRFFVGTATRLLNAAPVTLRHIEQ